MEREELKKMIEDYAESKVREALEKIKDDDNLEDKEIEFDEYDWLIPGDRMWITITADDIEQHEKEEYYDVELDYSFLNRFKSCALRITEACYCRDCFYEADIEYNEFFDDNDFEHFEQNHDYEEY